jgi:hypothetical protein
MTKSELWRIYVKKNPSFEGQSNIAISPNGLKKLFDQTWEFAQEAAKSQKPFDASIFGDMFRR